jgi:hypothetical protein
LPDDFEAVQAGDHEIEDEDIRFFFLDEADSFEAIGGFSDEFEVLLGFEQCLETLPDDVMVIGECEGDHRMGVFRARFTGGKAQGRETKKGWAKAARR